MATIFWQTEEIVLIDYKEKGVSITEIYYATLLERLRDSIKKIRPMIRCRFNKFLRQKLSFFTGVNKFITRSEKCIKIKEKYMEKQNILYFKTLPRIIKLLIATLIFTPHLKY